MLHIVWSILVGFAAGLCARALMPGAQHMGLVATTVLGIVGSVVGGYLGTLIRKPLPGARFHPAGFVMSIVGAIVLLLVIRLVR